jgi:hypothetical protein
MADYTFLNKVLAATDYYCIAGLKNKAIEYKFFKNLNNAYDYVDELVLEKKEVYFSCGKCKTNENRQANNISFFKSFFFDLDCGDDKKYVTKVEALNGLKSFCKTTGLPKPK